MFYLSFSFIGTFQVTKAGASGIKFFTIMDVHLRPDTAYHELLAMRYVIRDFILKHPQYFSDASTSVAQVLEQNVIGATSSHKPSLKANHSYFNHLVISMLIVLTFHLHVNNHFG